MQHTCMSETRDAREEIRSPPLTSSDGESRREIRDAGSTEDDDDEKGLDKCDCEVKSFGSGPNVSFKCGSIRE